MQSLHILAITVVLGSAVILDLRLAGCVAVDEPAHVVVRRYLPWSYAALIVLLLTGLTLCIGEPGRVLANQIFLTKMVLVVSVFLLTLGLRRPFLDPSFKPGSIWRGRHARALAGLSLLLWSAVVVCGRWIAYGG